MVSGLDVCIAIVIQVLVPSMFTLSGVWMTGYHITVFGASTYVCCITVHLGFNYGILDFCPSYIYPDLGRSLPAIAFIQQDFSLVLRFHTHSWTSTSPTRFPSLVVAVVLQLLLTECLPCLAYSLIVITPTVFGISAYACL